MSSVYENSDQNEELLQERFDLVKERLNEIALCDRAGDFRENPGFYSYFSTLASHMEVLFRVLDLVQTGALYELTLEELKELNKQCYWEILPQNYEKSAWNPAALADVFERKMGQYFSLLSGEVQGVTPYAYEGSLEELVRVSELIMELYVELSLAREELGEKGYKDSHTLQSVHDILYYYVSDYCMERLEQRTRELLVPSASFVTDFIMKSDFSDIRYLYYLGEYVSGQEIQMVNYLSSVPRETLVKAASVYTRGYRDGFTINRVEFEGKKTVNIRYRMGFEPLIREAVLQFQEMGLSPVIYRAQMMTTTRHAAGRVGFSSSNANLQFDYDHRFDEAVYLNKAYIERKLTALSQAYEMFREEAAVYGGPAVVEVFGENEFEPERKEACNQLSEHQQQLKVEYAARSGEITNQYMPSEQYSFTIVAYPVPEIGPDFPQIFKETLELNSLPSEEYRGIQQCMIDALDEGDSVLVRGMNGNETDLSIALHQLNHPERQTNFENCLADVNIPLGEVFTSPLLTGTNGLLHVKKVFLNGLEYSDLKLQFQDGMITEYSCDNFSSGEENKKFIKEQILFQHETLPMGEFAIGTNTKAYAMARKYGIQRKMPILIAEKTGPHFAVGDTCYSRAEDHVVYNPDGKEIIARENECSAKRHTDPKEAYFNCHTDITIPYDELGEIAVLRNGEKKSILISEGRFVLSGTEKLNEEL